MKDTTFIVHRSKVEEGIGTVTKVEKESLSNFVNDVPIKTVGFIDNPIARMDVTWISNLMLG